MATTGTKSIISRFPTSASTIIIVGTWDAPYNYADDVKFTLLGRRIRNLAREFLYSLAHHIPEIMGTR